VARRLFDRRSGCASCSGTRFEAVPIQTEGELRTYTIVAFAAPGIPVPLVAGVVDCGGTSVRANIVNVAPDPEHVRLGMKLRLLTFPVGGMPRAPKRSVSSSSRWPEPRVGCISLPPTTHT
jgi:uncharacterized OB-fold protein